MGAAPVLRDLANRHFIKMESGAFGKGSPSPSVQTEILSRNDLLSIAFENNVWRFCRKKDFGKDKYNDLTADCISSVYILFSILRKKIALRRKKDQEYLFWQTVKLNYFFLYFIPFLSCICLSLEVSKPAVVNLVLWFPLKPHLRAVCDLSFLPLQVASMEVHCTYVVHGWQYSSGVSQMVIPTIVVMCAVVQLKQPLWRLLVQVSTMG